MRCDQTSREREWRGQPHGVTAPPRPSDDLFTSGGEHDASGTHRRTDGAPYRRAFFATAIAPVTAPAPAPMPIFAASSFLVPCASRAMTRVRML